VTIFSIISGDGEDVGPILRNGAQTYVQIAPAVVLGEISGLFFGSRSEAASA
jgi:hypothetical protein